MGNLLKTISILTLMGGSWMTCAMESPGDQPWKELGLTQGEYNMFMQNEKQLLQERVPQGADLEPWKELGLTKAEYEKFKANEEQLLQEGSFNGQKEESYEQIRERFEAMKVGELWTKEKCPNSILSGASSKTFVIRRSWGAYTAQYPDFQRIVFHSGHIGHHGYTFGATQGPENYMIDNCEDGDVEPDAVLSMRRADHLAYIPSNSVDEIVADSHRHFLDEDIPLFQRLLKPGGRFVFHNSGAAIGDYMRILAEGEDMRIHEHGRSVIISSQFARKYHAPENAALRSKIAAEMLEIANKHYREMGYSKVELADFDYGGPTKASVYILTK